MGYHYIFDTAKLQRNIHINNTLPKSQLLTSRLLLLKMNALANLKNN